MAIHSSKHLIVLVGPTAVGKTSLSIQLAEQFQTEIISADARQFYQGMTIGTAQPTSAEVKGIPHHFLAFLPVTKNYSAGKFGQDAQACLQDLFIHKDVVIAVGGSGLYIQALCEGLVEIPVITPYLRSMLQTTLAKRGLSYLTKLLAQKDPTYHNMVDLKNPQRIIRALEVCLGTGFPYSLWRQQKTHRQIPPKDFHLIKMGLVQEKNLLHQQIDHRVDAMMTKGLLQEAEKLYPYQKTNALQAIGYKELFDYLKERISLKEAINQIKNNTKQYAKRQMTWFKKDQTITWFTPYDLRKINAHLHQQMLYNVTV